MSGYMIQKRAGNIHNSANNNNAGINKNNAGNNNILVDSFGRKIDYLRLSVTDRCNLRCTYCIPEQGINLLKHSDMLTYEEIEKSVKMLSDMGIRKIRITGGEPLVRKNIVDLIKNIKKNNGLEDLSITTNGILLGRYLYGLKSSGLNRINISIDSLDPEKFSAITRGGNLFDVIASLKKAIEMGFSGLNINTVITDILDTEDVREFIKMSMKMPVNIRFIEMMQIPLSGNNQGTSVECRTLPGFLGKSPASTAGNTRLGFKNIIRIMEQYGKFEKTDSIAGFGPSVYYKNKNSEGSIGFILNDKCFCSFCNRIRLTSSGKIKLCLFSDLEFDLKDKLRKNAPVELIKKQLCSFISCKPENREESCRLNVIETGGISGHEDRSKNKKLKNDVELRLSDYMNRTGG